jgi:1,3-beta-glucan synthase component
LKCLHCSAGGTTVTPPPLTRRALVLHLLSPRVQLPGNPVVGEGKPENQNHAIIFTRGENVQAIDMNQEGYFEEALKMRCLLQEFLVRTSAVRL